MQLHEPVGTMKPALAVIPELSSCGLQICQHPQCWNSTRKFEREIQRRKQLPKISTKPRSKKHEEFHFEDENTIDGIPVMTIVNMLDDYGYSPTDRLTAEAASADGKQAGGFSNPDLPTDGFELITKLQLQSLANEVSNGITPAPANTPLQSSHGFADGSHPSEDSDSQEPVYLPNKRPPPQSVYRILPHSVNDMKFDLHKQHRKKIYIWKSKYSSIQRQTLQDAKQPVARKITPASNVLLPVDILPEKTNETQWRKQKLLKKAGKAHAVLSQSFTCDQALRNQEKTRKPSKTVAGHQRSPSDAQTAGMLNALYAIEKLRHVSVDVLLRVVTMALRNKVLTSKQATLLLRQVTGQTYNIPGAEKEPHSTSKLEPKTITICQPSAASPEKLAPPTFLPSVYKLDLKQPGEQKKRKPSTKISPTIHADKMTDDVAHNNTSQRANRSMLRSRVGLVGSSADDVIVPTPPAKPFHYLRSSQDMGLHPIPTPPPATPSTERDSQYNDVVGGSTMVVNLSNPQSLCTDRPLSGGSLVSWKKSMTSIENQTTDRRAVSSSKSTMWPQVEETDFMESSGGEGADPSGHLMDFHNRGIPEGIEIKLPALQETAASVVETNESEEASPVPPPPSPEVPHAFNKAVAEEEEVDHRLQS